MYRLLVRQFFIQNVYLKTQSAASTQHFQFTFLIHYHFNFSTNNANFFDAKGMVGLRVVKALCVVLWIGCHGNGWRLDGYDLWWWTGWRKSRSIIFIYFRGRIKSGACLIRFTSLTCYLCRNQQKSCCISAAGWLSSMYGVPVYLTLLNHVLLFIGASTCLPSLNRVTIIVCKASTVRPLVRTRAI